MRGSDHRRLRFVAIALGAVVVAGSLPPQVPGLASRSLRVRTQSKAAEAIRANRLALERAIASRKANPTKEAALAVERAVEGIESDVLKAALGPAGPARSIPSITSLEEAEPNGRPGQAMPLNLTYRSYAAVSGSITAGDIDYFRFSALAGAKVWAFVDTGGARNAGATSRDAQLALLAGDGKTIIESDDDDGSGGAAGQSGRTVLATTIAGANLTEGGAYFIEVNAFSPTDVIDPYRLFVVISNATAAEIEPNNTGANAIVTSGSPIGVRTGEMSAPGDVDLYSVAVEAGNMLYVSADGDPERDGIGTDLVVDLLAPDGKTLLFSADSSGSGDASNAPSEAFWYSISTTGNYLVRARHYSAPGTGTYALMVANTSLTGSVGEDQHDRALAPLAAVIASAGATLVAEGCTPANGALDPNENVTVSFCIQNTGSTNTTNLVGTLQATGGVTSPSGPQNYGVVVAGGPAVCRNFTFIVAGTCGGTITASIQFQDGMTNLGTVTYTFTLGVLNTAFQENFDGVAAPALPAGWTTAFTNGDGDCTVGGPLCTLGSNWTTVSTTPDTAPNAAFHNDPSCVTDNTLDTPTIAITTASAQLTFRNNYILESTFDGGVLEIMIGAGPFTDIITAGGSFVTGGYNGTISGSFLSPIAGRAAWTGSSGGYITTTANLPAAAAGQNIKLRFRLATDCSVGSTGWRVDTIRITDGFVCATTCPPLPCVITCPANITKSNDPNQCVAVVTYPAPSTTGSCGTVTCSPASGSSFPKGTTTVTCTTTAGPTCPFTVTVVDTQPPTINCPANVTKDAAPLATSAVVTYPPPTASDNCPGVGMPACSPASGSTFPVGTTTVTCSVADSSGNTASCAFTVRVNLVIIIQDDGNGNCAVVRTTSTSNTVGTYCWTKSDNTKVNGPCAVTFTTTNITFQNTAVDPNVFQGGVDKIRRRGNGRLVITRASPTTTLTITDNNIDNSSCTCP